MAPSTHVPADDACTPARAAGRAFAVALALLIGGCSLAPRHDVVDELDQGAVERRRHAERGAAAHHLAVEPVDLGLAAALDGDAHRAAHAPELEPDAEEQ